MAKFVIDTSALTNLGKSKAQINRNIEGLIDLIAKAKKKRIHCYIPPSVWDEMELILRKKKIPAAKIDKLGAWMIQKSPSRMELMIPSEFIYQYVGEIRDRFNKGLRTAEKAVLAKGGNRRDDVVIKDLREKYRVAIRKGILDSKEDLDVLLLAKEIKASVVAKDLGIMEWAEKWGIPFIEAESFPKLLKQRINKRGVKR